MLALLLILVGPDWLTRNTLSRTVLFILFCSPWVYYFGFSIYIGVDRLRNHSIRSLLFLIGNILLIVACFGGEKGILISVCGLSLICTAGLMVLIPKINVLPEKLSKSYKSLANKYEEINKSDR